MDRLVGMMVGDQYRVTEPLYGDADRGTYRASGPGPAARATLVTVSGAPLADSGDLEASLCPSVAGVATLRFVGRLGDNRTAMVVDAPLGEPLSQLMPIAPASAAELALALFDVLARLHRLGRTASGVRPELVWLERRPEGTAFAGLTPRAERFFAGTADPCAGTVPTFASQYLAPEQIAGEPGGAPADVFAACATVLAALSGRSPFGSDSVMAQVQRIVAGSFDVPDEPSPLVELMVSGLAGSAEARPSAAALVRALENMVGSPRSAFQIADGELERRFGSYLRSPGFDTATELASGLDDAGYELEARALEAYAERVYEIDAPWPWSGRTVAIGPELPADAAPGTLWFDVCEVSPMVRVATEWLALRPTAAWQFAGFAAVAEIQRVPAQTEPSITPLDRGRIACDASPDPVTDLTWDEARLYANYFGKGVASGDAWEQARDALPAGAYSQLWSGAAREWVSGGVSFSEDARVFLRPSTVGLDPYDEFDDDSGRPKHARRMFLYQGDHEADLGFRTGVSAQLGLFRVVTGLGMSLPFRLRQLVDRGRFWAK